MFSIDNDSSRINNIRSSNSNIKYIYQKNNLGIFRIERNERIVAIKVFYIFENFDLSTIKNNKINKRFFGKIHINHWKEIIKDLGHP